MFNIIQVADKIYQIDTRVRVPDPILIYFIAGEQPSLVDVGPATAVPAIFEGVRELGYDPANLSYVFITHIHIDHAGGVGYLTQQLPQVKVVVHQKGARHLVDPSKLIAGTRVFFGEDFEQEFGSILPVAEKQIHIVQGGESISLGERELKIIFSPGHAPDHISFHDSQSGGLFCGDALGVPLPEFDFVVPATPLPFDLDSSLETVDKLRELTPTILFYPHSSISREIDKSAQLAKESLKAYANIILEALRAGENLDQMVERWKAYLLSNLFRKFELVYKGFAAGYVDYFKRKNIT